MLRSKLLITAFLVFVALSPGHADVLRWTSLEERVADADLIVLGQVVGIESYRASAYDLREAPKTLSNEVIKGLDSIMLTGSRITVKVEEIAKGSINDATVRFQVVGGHVGLHSTEFDPGHEYRLGSDVVVFLAKITEDSTRKSISIEKDFDYALSSGNGLFYVTEERGVKRLHPAYSGSIAVISDNKASIDRGPFRYERLQQLVNHKFNPGLHSPQKNLKI